MAYITLDPERLSAFGLSLSAAILSMSNILFWTQSGYFDVEAATKPLLHTWSLSVEEQFYLMWPLTLAIGYKIFKHRALKIISISAFLLSIGLIVLWTLGKFDARANSTLFYWMPFRVFEFMLGAMAVFLFPAIKRLQNFWAIIGVILTLAAFLITPLFVYEYGPVLGFLACLGTAMIIVCPQALISTSILQLSPVRWLGQISYSLYLVHWPVWIFAPDILKNSSFAFLILSIISILITLPIYYGVENPLRRGPKTRSRIDLIVYALIATSLVLLGQFLYRADKLPFREVTALTVEQIAVGKQKRYPQINCAISSDDCPMSREKQVLIFGNSHEPDARNSFLSLFENDETVNLISFGTINGCNLKLNGDVFETDVVARKCAVRTEKLNELLQEQLITHVVYAANHPFSGNKAFFWESLAKMRALIPDLEIIVMGGFLNTKEDCSTLINQNGGFEACFFPENAKTFNVDERQNFEDKIPYLYIDVIGLMCPERTLESCETSAYGEPVFYDKHHRSFGYSRLIGDRIKKEYRDEFEAIELEIP